MRKICLTLIAGVLLTSGCSVYIAESGSDLSKLTTREQVQEEFGKPCASGETEGQPFEDFRTRRKISEWYRSWALGNGIVFTFGLAEFIDFPAELMLLGRRTLFGQDVRFTYDSAGKVTRVYLDGEWLSVGEPTTERGTTVGTQSRDQR